MKVVCRLIKVSIGAVCLSSDSIRELASMESAARVSSFGSRGKGIVMASSSPIPLVVRKCEVGRLLTVTKVKEPFASICRVERGIASGLAHDTTEIFGKSHNFCHVV
jgi:hypothetical protein